MVNESFALCPVEIEIPCAVREHVIAGLEAIDPRTWFVAVRNATLHVCEDDPGNVPVEQDAITFSPEIASSLPIVPPHFRIPYLVISADAIGSGLF